MTKTCGNCRFYTGYGNYGECYIVLPHPLQYLLRDRDMSFYSHNRVDKEEEACSFWKERDSRGQCKCKDVFKGDVYKIVEDCPVHGWKR